MASAFSRARIGLACLLLIHATLLAATALVARAAPPGPVDVASLALYALAVAAFAAAGLGLLDVQPLAPGVLPLVLIGGVAALTAFVKHTDEARTTGVFLSTLLPLLTALLQASSQRRDMPPPPSMATDHGAATSEVRLRSAVRHDATVGAAAQSGRR